MNGNGFRVNWAAVAIVIGLLGQIIFGAYWIGSARSDLNGLTDRVNRIEMKVDRLLEHNR